MAHTARSGLAATLGLAATTVLVAGGLASTAAAQEASDPALARQAAHLRALVDDARELPFREHPLHAVPPHDGWELGMVSWVAMDGDRTYLLQRGDKADPVVVLDREGRVVDSWGKGLYQTPHAIRVDPDGNVWTTDAGSSRVIKYSPDGQVLMTLEVGGQPEGCRGAFCGTTDVAFGPDGRVFISDGYRNARILEYTADGRRIREWGEPGTGPGQFRLPHSIVVDDEGVIYVADRENGRVQRFDLDGNFLGMWTEYGKTFGLQLAPGAVWLATQQRNEPNLSPGWLLKVDQRSGELLGYVHATGVHGIAGNEGGAMAFSPGPDFQPMWFSPGR
jgi:hypothetical protein